MKQPQTTPLRMTLVDGLTPLLRVVLFPFEEIKKILYYHATYDQFMKQKKELEQLRSQGIWDNQITQENKRLKSLLDFKHTIRYPVVAATVVGREPSSWTTTLIIDKGYKDGIKQGMAVVNSSSVIGKIWEVGRRNSKVILLTDPSFSVAAVIERTREEGLIEGTLRGVCRMRYLSLQADIQIGDKVMSSKLSSFIPEGLLIGEVTEILEHHSDSPTGECFVRPMVSTSRVEEVLVIKK